MTTDLSIVVPCLNEKQNLEELFSRIHNSVTALGITYEIVIVDDGSVDGTSEEAVKLAPKIGCKVTNVIHQKNMGIFQSWKSGSKAAHGDFVLFMDADLQNKPESIPDLWNKMSELDAHLVQGVRIPSSSLDTGRARDTKALNGILNFFYRDNAQDSKSGFFIAPRSVVLDVLEIKNNYNFPHTFIRLSALSRSYAVAEVLTPFEARTKGESIFADAKIIKVYALVLQDVFRGLTEFRKKDHPARRALIEFSENLDDREPYTGLRKLRMNFYYATMPLHAWLLRSSSKHVFTALRKTQFADATSLEEFQLAQLQRVIWHAYVNVPYYRSAFKQAGVVPQEIRSLKDIEKLPLLSKDDVANNVHYGLFETNPDWKKLHKIVTSGSTGRPSTSYAEQAQLEIRQGSTLRSAEWTGWRIGDRQMRLWHQTLGMSAIQAFKERFDAFLLKRKFIPAFELTEESLAQLVNQIEDFRPVLMDGYAESLNFLASYTNSGHQISHKPKALMSSAQMLTTQTRDEIEHAMGCKVYDKYGAREFSGIAYECANGAKHVVGDSYIVEILKNNKSANIDEVGEVVITDLNNFAVPMIRYRIGDLALQVQQTLCECGRSFKQIGPIQGRTQALVHCANGRWIPGTFFAHFFKEYESQVLFFQVVQEVTGKFDLLIVQNSGWTIEGWDQVLTDLREYVGDTEISVQFVDEIPLLKTGKRTPVVSKVKFDFQYS
jgi:phenylacetate-CoA ligase